MHKRLMLVSIVVISFIIQLSIATGQNVTPQPTEESPPLVQSPTIVLAPPRYYPEYLMCEEVESGEGASWLDIEIGVSSLDDLLMTLSELGEYEIWLAEDDYIYLGRVEAEDVQLDVDSILAPSFVAACISDDDIITSFGILSRRGFQVDIYDLVSTYEIPDTVTWTVRPLSRIAFWFGAGIAVTMYVGPETEYKYLIQQIYYFPFVDASSFEDEYPYAFTRTESLSSVEQNPFDFDAMIATITAQPTGSPMPTFTPVATEAP